MNEIPLVRNNSINDINTSLIAIKKNIKQLDSVGNVSAPVANNNSGNSVSSIVTKLFVNAVYGRDTFTPLSIDIDNQTYNVKVNKNGNLVDFLAREMTENGITVFKYLQANTTLQFVIDGNTLIIIGNPLVISGNGYNYYADGSAINISYSIEEVATGGVWIDGKPIYRKVFTGRTFSTSQNTWVNTGYTLENVESIVIGAVFRNISASVTLAPVGIMIESNNRIQVHCYTGYSNCNMIVIEYTKTTD